MTYIYDILINFNKNLYDFYDWNVNDDIDHIRKIPVFKVDSATLWDFRNNDVCFTKSFLNQIYHKTEVFTVKSIKNLDYACLFCDGMEALGIQILDGQIKKSKLLIDEEEEVIEVCSRLHTEKIDYQIIHTNKIEPYKTRKELEMDQFVKQQMKQLLRETDENKLHYLYYECFNQKETNKEEIVHKFRIEMNEHFDELVDKLYQIFKLLQIHQ